MNLPPFVPSDLAWLAVTLLPICVYAVKLIQLNRQLRRDYLTLQSTVRDHLRKQSTLLPSKLFTPEAQAFERTLKCYVESKSVDEQQSLVVGNLITNGLSLVSPTDEPTKLADSICDLLIKQGSPSVVAAALILPEDNGTGHSFVFTKGSRLSSYIQPLTMLYYELKDRSSHSWGFATPNPGNLYDFSSIGIHSYLVLPLWLAGDVIGALWLGFGDRATDFSQKEKSVFLAIAKHAGQALIRALSIRDRIDIETEHRNFLLGVSHDLRTPGNQALFALRDMLSSDQERLTKNQIATLSIVESCIEDQLGVISDVLDLFRHQKGHLSAKPESIAIGPFLERILEPFVVQAKRKRLALNLEDFGDLAVFMDPTHLRRILGNLLSNALKYTDYGHVKVKVRSSVLEEVAYIEVIDTGIGVPHEQREKLFCQFQRMDNALLRSGIGLGLALTQVLAKLNNSEVNYSPNPTGGSIFVLKTPLCSDRIAPFSPTPSSGVRNSYVLIVEDDQAVARCYQRYLKVLSLDSKICSSVDKAFMEVEEQEPLLLICDLQLSKGTSKKLLLEIGSRFPNCPVIIATASTRESVCAELRDIHKSVFLEKPIEKTVLLATVERLLGKNNTR